MRGERSEVRGHRADSEFPSFLLSRFHLFRFALVPSCTHPDPIRGQKCLGMIRINLTTDGTDTIWIKDQFRVFSFSTFPLSSFPPMSWSHPVPILIPSVVKNVSSDPARGFPIFCFPPFIFSALPWSILRLLCFLWLSVGERLEARG